MNKMEIINLDADPSALKEGDIIGFNQFTGYSKVQVKGSSGLSIDAFQATVIEPNYRGFVLDTIYKGDKAVAVVVMPLAPTRKDVRVNNDDKNLMITNTRQHKLMGLNDKVNWRLNYMPVALELIPKNFSIPQPGRLVRFGTSAPDLCSVVLGHVDKLMQRGILHSSNFLPAGLARQLEGLQIARYDNIAGSEARISVHGDTRSAAAAAEIDARKAAAQRAERKAAKVEEARAIKNNMLSTPSGKIAYSLGLRFNERANPDISIETAHSLKFIDDDTYLVLDDIKESLGVDTIRTAYDAFLNDHAAVYDTLVAKNLCTRDNQETFKGDVEAKIKSAVMSFYKYFQALPAEQKAHPQSGFVTYASIRTPS